MFGPNIIRKFSLHFSTKKVPSKLRKVNETASESEIDDEQRGEEEEDGDNDAGGSKIALLGEFNLLTFH